MASDRATALSQLDLALGGSGSPYLQEVNLPVPPPKLHLGRTRAPGREPPLDRAELDHKAANCGTAAPPPPYRGTPGAVDEEEHRPFDPLDLFFPPCDPARDPSRSSLRPHASNAVTSTEERAARPPSYAETPRTRAERLFWYGFLLPPFLWLLGALRLWRSELPRTVQLKVRRGISLEEAEADVRESLERWREEELVWARRCLCAAVGAVILGSLLGVMLASLMGKL